jgi:hypothetical protein
MTDVDEQIKHPEPAKHSDNEKSKMPEHPDNQNEPIKKSDEGEPPVG